MNTAKELAVYIHWPFCKSKCPYCDFYKELAQNQNENALIEEYLLALQRYHDLLPDRTIKSVFFGGGTPSLLTPQSIERLLEEITRLWPFNRTPEISLEANPNTDRPELFTDLRHAGINRLSLGVQALNENDLRFLGRTHNLQTARQCLEKVVQIFDNHSADLIYARPQQTLASWKPELAEICSYGLNHISLYQLTIEEGTAFARRQISPLPEEEAAVLYDFTRCFLQDRGYELYEISNFARPGRQSVHNLTYWQGGDYIGIGKSAHGRLHLKNRFLAAEYPFKHTELTADERAEELLITGLRLKQGLNKKTFKNIIGAPVEKYINLPALAELKELHLLTDDSNYLTATATGLLVLDTILPKLCA